MVVCVCLPVCIFVAPQGLIAASDLYGEGYVDMDEFLAAMVANSSYSKTKDAVRKSTTVLLGLVYCMVGRCACMHACLPW